VKAKKNPGNENNRIRAFIGLGSNEGDRVGFVQQAMQLLKDIPRIEVVECSSLYETEPIGVEYVEWFVNAVAAIDTDLSSEDLLDVCKDIEVRLDEMHKTADHCKSLPAGTRSRIIDLDILFYGQQAVESSGLKIPHPSLHLRAFALVPLLEIAPDFMHPCLRQTVSELHEALPEPEQVYLYGTRGLDCDFG
jgi:2-amino-4-hydroxy-6-hydroxymethyldihydropteridine diphosphokinase